MGDLGICGSSKISCNKLVFGNISRLGDPPSCNSNPSSLKLITADAFATPVAKGAAWPSPAGADGKAAMGWVTSGISESKSVPFSS